ncbi:MAG: YARHG domain-containing protein [Pyrinomonadaceae bacterium]
MRKFILFIFVFSFCAVNSFSNDGVFYSQGGTLVPLEETQVQLKKEILKFYVRDIFRVGVVIDFDFYNPGDEKTVTVGFVTPPAGGDVEDEHPQITKFVTNVNGTDIPYKIQRMNETSFKGYSDDSEFDYVYYFPVTFKKGANHIHHTYTFRVNESVENRREINYQITTGKRWANGQIDDFELQVHFDDGIYAVPESFRKNGEPAGWKIKGEGVFGREVGHYGYTEDPRSKMVFIRNGYLSLKEQDFKPDFDISIREPNWGMGSSEMMCIDPGDCPKAPSELGNNAFIYFNNAPGDYLTVETLKDLTPEDLRLIRNFQYAIKGLVFKDKTLDEYFSKYFWYMPVESLKVEDIKLSDAQRDFLAKVTAAEKK